MKKILTCGLVASGLAILCVVAAIAGLVGLGRLAESLPTPSPQPTLIVGETYWTGAPAGLVVRWTDLQNKPGSVIGDLDVTIIAVLGDATEVELSGIRDGWCYVEAPNEFGRPVEGWLKCNRLLDYRPTPIPTPNLTPEKP